MTAPSRAERAEQVACNEGAPRTLVGRRRPRWERNAAARAVPLTTPATVALLRGPRTSLVGASGRPGVLARCQAVKSRAGVPLRAAFLSAATDPALANPLRVVGRAGAGTDHVELAAAVDHEVAVTHTPGSNASAVAEFTLAQLLTLTRDLLAHNEAAHQGSWRTPAAPTVELSELTLGILDEQALADALRDPAHPLVAVAVDTFEHEHAAFASPLFGLPNALLTPHVAGMTRSAMATAALRCADHIAALLADRPEGIPVVTLRRSPSTR